MKHGKSLGRPPQSPGVSKGARRPLGRAPRLGSSGGFFWFFACGAMPRNRAHRNKRDAKPTRSVGSDSTGPGTGAMNRARHRREFEADPCGPQCIQNKESNPGQRPGRRGSRGQGKTARRGQDPALQGAGTGMRQRAFAARQNRTTRYDPAVRFFASLLRDERLEFLCLLSLQRKQVFAKKAGQSKSSR